MIPVLTREGPYTVTMLIEDLIEGGGCLFTPTQTQLNVAEDNPFLVTIRAGDIYLISNKPTEASK